MIRKGISMSLLSNLSSMNFFYVLHLECFEKIDYDTTLKNNTTKNIKAILDYISENAHEP